MRWGKEEVFWHDLFNGNKISTSGAQVNETERSNSIWQDFDWNFTSIWEDRFKSSVHTFACFYGDIKSIHIHPGEKVDLELKNGAFIKLRGGSNDIGTRIRLEDYELGVIKFSWDKIKRIDFYQAPKNAQPEFGKALYGVVKTLRKGSFEGYIKWDKDERTSLDILDGDSKHGTQKIPFGKIKRITKVGSDGCDILFKNGSEYYVDDSNDVDSGNRGVRVFVDHLGVVDVSWKEFDYIEFINPKNSGLVYDDFDQPIGLKAEVTDLTGTSHNGMIIYDIDEMWELEMLDGEDDYLDYYVPFRYISKIQPKNKSFSLIYLNNGETLLLGDTHDVSSDNDGIILQHSNKQKPNHFLWDEIDHIIFK